ncbi:hypothetical protein COOONC_21610 [Cooperia oncophora]
MLCRSVFLIRLARQRVPAQPFIASLRSSSSSVDPPIQPAASGFKMEHGPGIVEDGYTRNYFVELVNQVHTEEDIADIITLYGTLSGDELELALPSLCLLAERCPNGMKEQMMDLARLTLTDANSSRSARKAAISCLKTLTQGNPVWFNFFTLAQCLEEPQVSDFHKLGNLVLVSHTESCATPIGYRAAICLFAFTSFKWAKVLFIRALAHSNGWVRLWALEKLVAVKPSFMALDLDFLFSVLLKHLDSNDPFWRLLERQKLKSFMEFLTSLFQGISTSLDDAGTFIRQTLRSVSQMSSPSSLYFVSQTLREMTPPRCLCSEDFPLIVILAQKTRHIQHTTMRLTTLCNFVVFFSKTLELSCEAANEIGVLTAFFSREDPSLFDRFVAMESSQELLRQPMDPLDMINSRWSVRGTFRRMISPFCYGLEQAYVARKTDYKNLLSWN